LTPPWPWAFSTLALGLLGKLAEVELIFKARDNIQSVAENETEKIKV
jgi:hypothetical protein